MHGWVRHSGQGDAGDVLQGACPAASQCFDVGLQTDWMPLGRPQ
jgi:hypothetical protein